MCYFKMFLSGILCDHGELLEAPRLSSMQLLEETFMRCLNVHELVKANRKAFLSPTMIEQKSFLIRSVKLFGFKFFQK